MSLSEDQLNIVQDQAVEGRFVEMEFEEIDWHSVIHSFGSQHEMKFKETLRWISNRTSLQVACEVVGVALSPSIAARYTTLDLRILNSLGDFLAGWGFKVPRLMEHRRMEYVRKGRERMGFSLSREEYLRERAVGKSKNKIAHQQGISGPALFHWLNKWGLRDSALEQREIERLLTDAENNHEPKQRVETETSLGGQDEGQVPVETYQGGKQSCVFYPARKAMVGTKPEKPLAVTQFTPLQEDTASTITTGSAARAARTTATGLGSDVLPENLPSEEQKRLAPNVMSDASDDASTEEITFRIELPFTAGGNSKNHLVTRMDMDALSRDELMQHALCMLQAAVGQAYVDLTQLLGERAARQQIHAYVLHQVENFIK